MTIREVMYKENYQSYGLKMEGSLCPVHYYHRAGWERLYNDYLDNKVVSTKVNPHDNSILIVYKGE